MSPSVCTFRFNSAGTRIIAFAAPAANPFNVESPVAVCEFVPGYYSCTMKSCCFGGPNDDTVLSGSDDSTCHMWQISDDETSWQDRAHTPGSWAQVHRNQVRYNPPSDPSLVPARG